MYALHDLKDSRVRWYSYLTRYDGITILHLIVDFVKVNWFSWMLLCITK